MRHAARIAQLFSIALIVVAAACSDSAAPQPKNPVDGVWDVTTVLDTFTFETSPASYPDCDQYAQYCTHRMEADGAILSGTLTIRDDVPDDDALESAELSGSFVGRFCDDIAFVGATGCLQLPPSTIEYPIAVVYGPSSDASGAIFSAWLSADGMLSPKIGLTNVEFDGDSLHGDITWSLTEGRSPPTYRGTFVAHRRP